jgi:hypothetical protein
MYFCLVTRKFLLSYFSFLACFTCLNGQVFIPTHDRFHVTMSKPGSGDLNIIQDPGLDTLISRYILSKAQQTKPNGFRILVYRNSELKARNESESIYLEFSSQFPDIPCYRVFQEPNYYLVLAGNFRLRTYGLKSLLMINKKYPEAIFIPYLINFDDLNKTDSKK